MLVIPVDPVPVRMRVRVHVVVMAVLVLVLYGIVGFGRVDMSVSGVSMLVVVTMRFGVYRVLAVRRGVGAVVAESVQWEVVEVRVVADLLTHDVAHGVEPGRVDCGDATASVAYEVFDFSAAGQGVEARPLAEVKVAYDAERLEAFEVAVDRGWLEPLAAALASAGDVLGGDGALGGEERFEHQSPRQREATAAPAKLGSDVVDVVEIEWLAARSEGHRWRAIA
jgi:hypothetical protein